MEISSCRIAGAVCSACLPLMLAGGLAAAERQRASAVPIQVEKRGLLQIEGFLRGDSEGSWGSSNLVVKPVGGWAAQDYCLEGIVANGAAISADFATSPRLRMVETTSEVKDAGGTMWTRVAYELTPADGRPATYERVFAVLPLAVADVAGGKVLLPGGKAVPLPAAPAGEVVVPAGHNALAVAWGRKRLAVRSDTLRISVRDLRPAVSAFQIQLDQPQIAGVAQMAFAYEVSAQTAR